MSKHLANLTVVFHRRHHFMRWTIRFQLTRMNTIQRLSQQKSVQFWIYVIVRCVFACDAVAKVAMFRPTNFIVFLGKFITHTVRSFSSIRFCPPASTSGCPSTLYERFHVIEWRPIQYMIRSWQWQLNCWIIASPVRSSPFQ
jgi:hypothetical protein